MPVTVILELRLKPDVVSAACAVMGRALRGTRAFDENLGNDVLVDQDDEARWLIHELRETVEHDEAYRRFRAAEGRLTELPSLLATPPVKEEVLHYRYLAQSGNYLAFEKLDSGAVIRGLREIADRILTPEVTDLRDPLDHLFRRARRRVRATATGDH